MAAACITKGQTEPEAALAVLRAGLLDLIAAVHDREAEIAALPDRSDAEHAVLAALFAARVGLQDQIVTLRRAEVLGSRRPDCWVALLRRACGRMKAAQARAVSPDQVIAAALDGVAAARRLLADLRGGEAGP